MRKKTAAVVDRLLDNNAALALRAESLQNALKKSAVLKNTLTDLTQALGIQTNLTSFNPIIQNNIYAPITLDWLTLTYFYKTHGVIQTAIEMPVLDALRGGVDIASKQMDPIDIKKLLDFFEDNDVGASIGETGTWARLYGGAGLVVNIPNQDPETPLSFKNIKAMRLYPANRWELGAGYKAEDSDGIARTPIEEYNARFSEFYNFYGNKIHHSRVFTLSGKNAPHVIRWQLQGWGMSEVERMVEDFNLYIRTKNVLYELLQEAKVDIFKMENFNSSLLTDTGTQQIFQRIQKAQQLKSFNKGLLLDKLDDYEQKQITFTGIAEVMKENRIGIASAMRMPMAKLFGLSAAGFNSGEDDIENYNAMVESEVRQKLRPLIRKVIALACVHLFGTEIDFDFSFKPLRVLGAVEEEQVKTSLQNRMTMLYDRGLMTAQEVMEELSKAKIVTIPTAVGAGMEAERPDLGGNDQEEGGKENGSERKREE